MRENAVLDLTVLVAERALEYPYQIWGFGEGMALLGLIQAGVRLERPAWIDAVADLVGPTLTAAPAPTDHLIAVDVLVALAAVRPVAVDDAVARFRSALRRAARPVPGRPAVHRPDLPALGTTLWVDCLHTDGPGLAPGDAAAAVEEASAVLQDATGLYSHGYDVATARANGVHWGRGQGWALHGLRAVSTAVARRDALLTALARYEDDGSWRTIVDDPAAPVEHSVSALVAAAGGVGPHWTGLRRRARAAALAAVGGDGGLPVSAATPVGDRAVYLDRATGVYPWGQGPLLLALLSEELT